MPHLVPRRDVELFFSHIQCGHSGPGVVSYWASRTVCSHSMAEYEGGLSQGIAYQIETHRNLPKITKDLTMVGVQLYCQEWVFLV